jgi:hypothetical protein
LDQDPVSPLTSVFPDEVSFDQGSGFRDPDALPIQTLLDDVVENRQHRSRRTDYTASAVDTCYQVSLNQDVALEGSDSTPACLIDYILFEVDAAVD